jgi:hypothetical protein
VIPGLNDHELPDLLSNAGRAGATFAAYVPVRPPYAARPLFENCSLRVSHEWWGLFAEHIAQLFSISCRSAGIERERTERGRFPKLSTTAFRRRGEIQPELFD